MGRTMATSARAAHKDTAEITRFPRPRPSHQSLRGLDWFIFCLADVQVGFGAFVAVYLAAEKWTQGDIGLVLTLGTLVALACQIPGGALVDATSRVRLLAAGSVIAIAVSALAIALLPIFAVVLASSVVHAVASCIIGPAIAAITLGLVGYDKVAERLGRNASLAAIGAGLAAAGMGVCGYLISSRAVFFATVALCVPVLVALQRIRPNELNIERAHGGRPRPHPGDPAATLRDVARNRMLMTFTLCMVMFHLANAAMLPTLASVLTMRSSESATALIGACMVVPQIIVAVFSPWIGRHAESLGHHTLLLVGFAALPIRGALLAFVSNPYALVLVQSLDGVSAAVLGVMVPLIIAEASRGTGHFNLGQGVVGSGIGIGASLSTTMAGYVSDHFGNVATFAVLASIAIVGLLFVLAMSVQRPNVAAVSQLSPRNR